MALVKRHTYEADFKPYHSFIQHVEEASKEDQSFQWNKAD